MTAHPAVPAAWSPDPVRQRRADHLLEDVLGHPDDAPGVELRDGVMIVVPSPTLGHQSIGNPLGLSFRQDAPEKFAAGTAVGVPATLQVMLSAPFEIKRPIRDIAP